MGLIDNPSLVDYTKLLSQKRIGILVIHSKALRISMNQPVEWLLICYDNPEELS